MADRVPARLSPGEGRKFGLTVGVAFLALAAFVRWRGGDTAVLVLGGLGAALVVGGLLVPGRLGPVHAGWMKLAHLISKVTTPIFMGLVYFVVLTPTGLIRRLFGGNPLQHRATSAGYWLVRPEKPPAPDAMSRQF